MKFLSQKKIKQEFGKWLKFYLIILHYKTHIDCHLKFSNGLTCVFCSLESKCKKSRNKLIWLYQKWDMEFRNNTYFHRTWWIYIKIFMIDYYLFVYLNFLFQILNNSLTVYICFSIRIQSKNSHKIFITSIKLHSK